MKVLFLTARLDGLNPSSPSPRIRCEWVAKHWDGAEVYDGTQALGDYDCLIFQKCYLTTPAQELAKRYRHKIRIADICDPEFLNPRKLSRLHAHLDRMDACVVPTEPLREWYGQWLPTTVIPDCVDLELHEPRTGDEALYFQNATGLVWFGGSQNYPALDTLMPVLATLDLPVVTISDAPYPNLPFIKWESVTQCNEWLKRFEIVLNPQPLVGEYRYKSDNKTVTAWALGLPVARDALELHTLLGMTPHERFVLGQERRRWVEQHRGAEMAARMWADLVERVKQEKAARGELE